MQVKHKWHILCEKDVGLFSLIQQVIAHVPMALAENSVPVALYREQCCYWHEGGYQGKHNVWEYYFEPIISDYPSLLIEEDIIAQINAKPPHFEYPGYHINEKAFVTNHFGDHPALRGKTLKIPHQWTDPGSELRAETSSIIKKYVRPRDYLINKVEQFSSEHFHNKYVIGVHMRATDVTDPNEHNIHRRGSFKLERYLKKLDQLLTEQPSARIFVATDSQKALNDLKNHYGHRVIHASSIFHQSPDVAGRGPAGWVIPGYLADNTETAAQNGEEAIIDYLLLSECQHLIHNGSGLARTALLKNADLPHTNIHSKAAYFKSLVKLGNGELFQYLRFSYQHLIHRLKKPIKQWVNWDKQR